MIPLFVIGSVVQPIIPSGYKMCIRDSIISIPLEVEEIIRIGVITHKDYRPTALGQMYLDILHRVVGDMQGE